MGRRAHEARRRRHQAAPYRARQEGTTMASKKLGITHCPECGHQKADIKISLDGENKKPYRHCPECYASYHPRNKHQADMLLAKMKDGAPAPEQDEPPAGVSLIPVQFATVG